MRRHFWGVAVVALAAVALRLVPACAQDQPQPPAATESQPPTSESQPPAPESQTPTPESQTPVPENPASPPQTQQAPPTDAIPPAPPADTAPGASVATPAPAPPAAATPPAPGGPPATVLPKEETQGVLGKEVRSSANESMGQIANVIVDKAGQPRAAVIDFGGFLGVGSRKIAVDWNALHFAPGQPPGPITLDFTRNELKAAPEYKEGQPVVVLSASGSTQPIDSPEQPEH